MAVTRPLRSPAGWRGAILCLILALYVPALAQAQAGQGPAAEQGVALMAAMQQAARTLDYAGVFTYQQGSVMVASQVAHLVDGKGERQRVELLDGQPHREFLRLNDEVRSLLPELRMVLIEKRRTEHFPVFFHGPASELATHYGIGLAAEPGRVAGRACRVVQLRPRDTLRWGYELCVDEASSLLLKAQTLDAEGRVLEQVAFSEVRIGGRIDPALLEPAHDTSAWREVHHGEPVDLAAAGWRVQAPAGFAPLSQMKRTLKQGKHVRQMLLSDGIAAISVFIENRKPAPAQLPGATEHGATSVYCRELGDYWLTVLGEAPMETIRQVAESIEFAPPAP